MGETVYSQILIHRLHEAIDNNDIENVRMCIKQRVDLNKTCFSDRYREHMCPLALACRRGHEEAMEELIKAGANPNQVSGRLRLSAMFIAEEKGVLTLSLMRCLISHNVDVDFRDGSDWTLLHHLARGRFSDTRDNLLSAAKLELDNGASVDSRDGFDYTPLYLACEWGNIDLAKLFIAEGADVNCNIRGQTMLRMVADRCDIDMFDSLLNAGANRQLDPVVLIEPCNKNNHAMIARILDTCDVDINMLLDHYGGMTILHYACEDPDITSETVRLLLDRGADVRAVSNTGDNALHYADIERDCNKIRHLLTYNLPLNIKNNKNHTPLATIIEPIIASYEDAQDQRDYATNLYQVGLLAFKMHVTAGAKVTADDKHKLNQFRIKYPEAQLPDYEIRSTRSLKEVCRFVIRGAIPVPVDVSLCKLPIPKLLKEYLNFPEFDPLDKYLKTIATTTASEVEYDSDEHSDDEDHDDYDHHDYEHDDNHDDGDNDGENDDDGDASEVEYDSDEHSDYENHDDYDHHDYEHDDNHDDGDNDGENDDDGDGNNDDGGANDVSDARFIFCTALMSIILTLLFLHFQMYNF